MKKTVLIGATENSSRYAYLAALRLQQYRHPLTLLGVRPGKVGTTEIRTDRPGLSDIDTITLYINPQRQKDWYDYILSLRPQRIIFNPGTENPELADLAQAQGIETVEGCTLVMLSVGLY